jgi:hypothetical protein
MAKVKFNAVIEEMHGSLGNMVFRRLPNGEVITSKRPDMSNVEWSEDQDAQRERFASANAYARAAMADPDVRAIYEEMAAKEERQPYRVAMSDYFKGNNLLLKK